MDEEVGKGWRSLTLKYVDIRDKELDLRRGRHEKGDYIVA